MVLRRFIALENLKKTQPPIDEDQILALLHAPFTWITLFGGELAKLQEANTKGTNAVTVYPPTVPPVSYPSRPYVGRGRSFNYPDRRVGYSRRGGGRGRVQGRSTPNATNTTKPKEGQTTMTVSLPPDSRAKQRKLPVLPKK